MRRDDPTQKVLTFLLANRVAFTFDQLQSRLNMNAFDVRCAVFNLVDKQAAKFTADRLRVRALVGNARKLGLC